MAVINIPVTTPCGTKTIKLNIPIAIPPIDLSFFLSLTFPPKFRIPLPNCSLLEHIVGVAPEDPADSVP